MKIEAICDNTVSLYFNIVERRCHRIKKKIQMPPEIKAYYDMILRYIGPDDWYSTVA